MALRNKQLLVENIETLFKKFTVKEVISDILPLIPNTSLEVVQKGLKALRLEATARRMGQVILKLLKNESYDSIRQLQDRVKLMDLCLHKTATWIPFVLLNPVSQREIQTTEQMERLVLQAMRIKKMNADIYAVKINTLFYVMVVCKKLTRKNGVKLTAPIYFCKKADEPYVFLRRGAGLIMLPIIVSALGYEDTKKQSRLSGKDVMSLLKMLKNKANPVKQPEEIPYEVQLSQGHRAKLMLPHQERLKHINHYLGEDTIVLEELTVHGLSEFKGGCEQYLNKPFKTSMTIRSNNVRTFIKHMAFTGIMKPPFPNYIKQLNVIGKNEISLKE